MNLLLTDERFQRARVHVLSDTEAHTGIGMLSEKTLHRMLKFTVTPEEHRHEVKVLGRVADVLLDEGIVEIQTRSLFRLRPKLDAFLDTYDTAVIYPLPHEKQLCWIDPHTGELQGRRRSPKRCTPQDAIPELFRLTEVLSRERLSVYLVFLDVEEYRYLNGRDATKKRGSTRVERMAKRLHSVVRLDSVNDYRTVFLPEGLSMPFTVKEYARATRTKVRWAYAGIRMLISLGILSHTGMRGREYLYSLTEAFI